MKTTTWTKLLVVNFLSSIPEIKGVLFKRTIASTFTEYDKFYPVKVYNNSQASNQVECALLTSILMGDGQQRSNPEKEIIANSFRFTTMGSICESGVVPFFSGDYDDKPPITAPNGAIHVAYGRVAKRSNLLADIFVFGPLHDSKQHLLFLKDNHLNYLSTLPDQSTIQYEIPSPIRNARAILFRSDETIVSTNLPVTQLQSFSIFVWYHGNGVTKTSRPIIGMISNLIWNLGAQLFIGKQVPGQMTLVIYPPLIPAGKEAVDDSTISVSNNVWNLVGVTYDVSTEQVRFYLNGTQLGTTQSLSLNAYPDIERVTFGGFTKTTFCECALDGAEFYMRAISDIEAQQIFTREYP